uniref:Uncharacterized protein n=1 Tax=Nelumbo nucifera TaxID=4432 RepID=A0A822ZZ71_NELNU|nr:TPA_asm: hypothetical protein HUJ06_017195 [Nelumbo nucifera]
MRGTTAISLVKNILKQVYCPMKRRSSGIMATSAPSRQSNDDVGEGEGPMTDDKAEQSPSSPSTDLHFHLFSGLLLFSLCLKWGRAAMTTEMFVKFLVRYLLVHLCRR